ncbi:MAG: RNA-binding protein [Bacteroidetes bacterium]|nr:RNA-binding protein [Bacteroidota bacterium]
MTNIFIANLDWEISSDDLHATFSAFGKVSYAHVVFDKATKKSKGFGYVEMDNTDEAIVAIEALKGLEVNGRKLDVKIASPKGSRPEKVDLTTKKFQKPFNKTRGPGGGSSSGGYRPSGNSNSNSGNSNYNKRPRINNPGQGTTPRD